MPTHIKDITSPTYTRVQELCESQGGCPGLSVLMSLMVSVDIKQHWTMLRHWSQLVPNMSTDVRGHEARLHHHHLHHLVLCFSWTSTDGIAWSGVCVSLQASSATRHSCSPLSVHWRPIKISTCVTASMWHLSSVWRCRHRWSMPLSKLHSFGDLKLPFIALGSDVKNGFRWGWGGGGGGGGGALVSS